MKLLFEINKKYREPEIHICCESKTKEALGIRELLESVLYTRITVYKEQEARSLSVYEIVRIYSENKRVYVRTGDEVLEVRDRLYVLEETLRDKDFVRISNSELVNISQIEKMDMSYSGTIKMIMKNGDATYVSRRYVARIKEVLS